MRLDAPVCPDGARCQHARKSTGQRCNEPLDRKGWRARVCAVGGSRARRQNHLRDWRAKRRSELAGHAAPTEQR
eukprot:3373006-Pyramimonas_sp.AAC.1